MRRRSTPLRTPLLAATVLTVLAVALGTLLAPGRVRLTAADAQETLVGTVSATARPAVTSRNGNRDLVRARSAIGKDTLPPYRVKQASAPIKKLPPPPPEPVPGTPFTFQVGTLNILGSQHRRNGPGRAAALAGAITGRGVDLVGLQEVQDDQLAVLQGRLPGYGIWPARALGNNGVRLQIAFSHAMFELVDTGYITTVFDHQTRPIPYVLLRNKATNGEFYAIDVHNSPRDQEGDRDAATGAEIALVNQLRATGKPVMIMGDTNEHTEFACRVMASTGMVGYNGANAAGGCALGAGPIKIDWILGGGGVSFSGAVVDYGAPVAASTDHAFVRSTATVTPSVLPQR